MKIGPREQQLRAQREAKATRGIYKANKDVLRDVAAAIGAIEPRVTKKAANIGNAKRGRPRKSDALTPAQKQKTYRDRKAKSPA